jgi:hypothetical protein
MDLIQYLTQTRKKETKKDRKQQRVSRQPRIQRQARIPRRARGYGQRHKIYREKKEKTESEIDKKILALLTAIVKQNKTDTDLSNPEALNPFVERDRQKYSMTFEPKVKTLEERLAKVEKKSITMGETKIDPEKQEQKSIELATIHNEFVDYENKWNEVIDTQEKLNEEISTLTNINENAQEEFRLKNVEIKENILSLQNQLQEELNEAKDLNDYKEFIDFQKKVLDKSINNFVSVDNRLAEELVKGKEKLTQEAIRLDEEQKGFEKLQEQTFNEKLEIKKQMELLNVDLEKSQVKVKSLTDELNSTTDKYTELQEKHLQLQTNPSTEPPRVEVESVELPKPKPTEEELQAKRQRKEDMRIGREKREREQKAKEIGDKRLTNELLEWLKTGKGYGSKTQDKIISLFGEEENKKLLALSGSRAFQSKKTKIKQLLQEKRGVEF